MTWRLGLFAAAASLSVDPPFPSLLLAPVELENSAIMHHACASVCFRVTIIMITLCGEVASHRKRLVGSIISAISQSTAREAIPSTHEGVGPQKRMECATLRLVALVG